MPWVLGLVLKAWQFRVISPRRCICKNPLEFQRWIVNFQVEVCAKAKNLALVLQWIKRSKQPARWRTSSIPNQLREKISLIMKNWIWWWRAELKWCYDIAYLIYEISERSAVTRQKGRNTLTPSGRLKNVFSGRQLGLVQEETLVVFYTRMLRETARTSWDEVERRKKISPRARVLFSTESEDTDWREKLEQSKGQSCD